MSKSLKIFLGYTIICIVWGSTWLAIRLGLDSLTPIISAGLRFFIASIIIFIIIFLKKIEWHLDRKAISIYLFLAFFSFVIPFGLVYWAEQFIPSGLTSVMFGVFPFSVFIFSWFILKNESADFFKLLSVILGFVGIVIIFADSLHIDLENHTLGLAAVLVSASIQGSASVVLKKWGGYLNPFSLNAVPLFIAGLSMIILSFLVENKETWVFDKKAIISILYLAIIGTILVFTIYYWLLKHINVVILSLSSFITPIIALILGWIFLNESLSKNVLIGSMFVLIGILFGNLKGLRNYYFSKKGIVR